MKALPHISGLMLAAVVATGAPADETLKRARAAYDEGRFGEAAAAYEELLAAGADAPEVRFNLGNALYRQGSAPRAILEYRRAWRLAPRDPDIAANLGLALDRQGAPRPREPHWTAWPLERMSRSEAGWMAIAGWWIACLLFAGSFMRVRGAVAAGLRKAAAVALASAAVGAAATGHWRGRDAERVVIESGHSARYAPLENASVHFTVPAGSIVDGVEDQGPWIRIRLAGREGWIPRSIAEPVAPDS